MRQTNLIKLYCTVSNNSSTIEVEIQRQSNNFHPEFTDEEYITVYLWGDQLAAIWVEDDLQVHEKLSSVVVYQAAQLSGILRQAE